MPSTQQSMALVVSAETAARLYAVKPEPVHRERRIPLSREVLDLLPTEARRAIKRALARGGMEAFLVPREGNRIEVYIRNKKRY